MKEAPSSGFYPNPKSSSVPGAVVDTHPGEVFPDQGGSLAKAEQPPPEGHADGLSDIPVIVDRKLPTLTGVPAVNWRRNNLGDNRFPHSITRAYRLKGEFDLGAYEQALNHVVGRHEALRVMHRCLDDGGVERVVLESFALNTVVVDLSGQERAAGLTQARDILDQESVEPLELTEGVPVRSRIIRLSQTDHVAMLTFYHGLVDGIGLSVVLRELSTSYDAFARGRRPQLAPVKVQAIDYAGWQDSWMGVHEDRLKAYWEDVFAKGVPEIRLRLDSDERPTETTAGLLQRLLLPSDLMDRVESRAHYHGMSRFRYLFAGAFLMFARDPEADVRMLMTIVNARRHPEAESVVGQFIEGVPVIIPDLKGMSVGQAVETVGAQVNEVVAHAIPRAVVMGRRVLEKEKRTDNPFGLVYFNQVPDLESDLCLDGVDVEPWLREHIAMRGMLGITVRSQSDGSTFVQLNHPVYVFSRERGMRLLERFRDTVIWMLDHPEGVVTDSSHGADVSETTGASDLVGGDLPEKDTIHMRVMELFKQSLGRTLPADQSLFDAGADSLTAATLLHRVNREFGTRLAFRVIEQASTPLELSALIRAQMEAEHQSVPTERVATVAGNPLVRLPRPVEPTLIPDPPAGGIRNLGQRYMICRAYEVGKGFSPSLFEEAFRQVVARHDALRRCYRRSNDGRFWLIVRDDPKLKIDQIDLSHLPSDLLEAKVTEHYEADSRRPLKPYSGVMHRVTMLHCGPDRSVIIFTFCHRFVDGISVVQVLSDVSKIYQALVGNQTADLPPVEIQDSDFEAWLDEWNESERPRLERYWRGMLGQDVPPRLFEAAPPLRASRRSKGRFLNFTVSSETMEKVRQMASSIESTAHYVVLAASHVFFQRWLGVDDLITSSVADLRIVPEAEGVVGNFVSNTPMRVGLTEADTLAAVVKRVSQVGREAMDHRSPRIGLIFRALLDEIGYPGSPLGCIYLNQVPDTYRALDLGSVPVRTMLREWMPGSSFGFSHRFVSDGSLGLQVQFPIHKISAEAFEPLLEDWRLILGAIANKPSLRVGELQKIGQDTKLG